MAAAVRTLRSHAYGLLATATADEPDIRLVQHLRVDDDATVWFGTSPRSRKAEQIRLRPGVSYAVEDRQSFAYAVVLGPAQFVDDTAVLAALWEPGLEAFFPAGPGGGDFTILRIVPSRIELMSFADGVHPEPYGLRPAVVDSAAMERSGDA